MSFNNIDIKSSYETGQDDLIQEFYVPVLENAVSYDRIAGFFSSSCLAISAKGIVGLIKNGGKMRIIACPKINQNDVNAIYLATENPEKYLEDNLLNELQICEDVFEQQHVNALGWLVAKQLLEIKIAFVYENGKLCTGNDAIFHQKVGILCDEEGNEISFSGSINETASGWLKNIEEFKVFKSWKTEQKEYINSDIKKFHDFWNSNRKNVKMYNLPITVKKRLIEYADNFEIEKITAKQYNKNRRYNESQEKLNLFNYQKEAIKKWEKNNRKLLFQMATGTGKTRTAIGCIADVLNDEDKVLIIVSCPQGTLSMQWKEEIDKLNLGIEKSYVIDGTNTKWKSNLKELILKSEINYYTSVIVYTTHRTCSKSEFIESINMCSDRQKILFIGDEAHGLGSVVYRRGLLDRYNYRIGLSATPSRWFDESGTTVLEKYFGNDLFEFSIADALTKINPLTNETFLVNYYYKLSFVDLDDQEIEEYKKLSSDVIKMKKYAKESIEYEKRLENILYKRANIVKNANAKYEELEKIINLMNDVKDTIIFVSDEQIDEVLRILGRKKIVAHRLTQNEKTIPDIKYGGKTERMDIIDKFKTGYYKVLVAIKCLDEGIDIPSASTAILMASSTNPREYVQRIGRVIRWAPGKTRANIYDISIRPSINRIGIKELVQFERLVISKERNRLVDISTNALNNAEALELINSVLE
ncbi:DEAD/DEAH box helicase family protein [Clostridium sp. AWRP]|uniref:DEAD/DEAH box helicase family protein n=1 Tax=Clostridium sp. AWRP TaxID=2212991 RepID=UPI000FD8D64E|nr:DEAD/DEAH box helicase family protein [Clostridium sp. AWRP]AZV56427.1 DEAD/DEAH box helicase [Clostridium sp. AWRP]